MEGKWRSIAELVGLCAVVLSLLLVAYELRQAQLALSATAHSERADRLFSIFEFMANSGFSEIAAKRRRGEELTGNERQVLESLFHMTMRHFEDLHYQYRIGAVEEETWKANVSGLTLGAFRSPIFDEAWQDSRSMYEDSFARFVDEARAESGDG